MKHLLSLILLGACSPTSPLPFVDADAEPPPEETPEEPEPDASIAKPDACKPLTCAKADLMCGDLDTGCGKIVSCGTCPLPTTCGGGGLAGVCGSPSTALVLDWSATQAFDGTTAGTVESVSWRPDGTRFAAVGGHGTSFVTDGRAVTFDTSGKSATVYGFAERDVIDAAFSPDGARLAVATYTGGGLFVLDVSTGGDISNKLQASCPYGAGARVGWLSKSLLAGRSQGMFMDYPSVCTYDVSSVVQLKTYKQLTKTDWAMAVKPSGTRIAAAHDDEIIVWDSSLTEITRANVPLPTGGWIGWDFAWIDGTDWVIYQLANTTKYDLYLFDAPSGASYSYINMPSYVTAIAYSAKRLEIATAHSDGNIRIWDVNSKKLKITQPHGKMVTALAWNPAGTKLVSGGQSPMVAQWTIK